MNFLLDVGADPSIPCEKGTYIIIQILLLYTTSSRLIVWI